jgi:hypothetical protein
MRIPRGFIAPLLLVVGAAYCVAPQRASPSGAKSRGSRADGGGPTDSPPRDGNEQEADSKDPGRSDIHSSSVRDALARYLVNGLVSDTYGADDTFPCKRRLMELYRDRVYRPALGLSQSHDRDEQTDSDRAAAQLIFSLSRSPRALQSLFESVAPDLPRYLPPSLYIRHGMHETIGGLVRLHQRYQRNPAFGKCLRAYHAFLSKEFRGQKDEEQLLALFDSHGIELYSDDRNHGTYLAFWARREREENREAVANILKRVQAIYRPGLVRDEKIRAYENTLFAGASHSPSSETSDTRIYPYGWSRSGCFYYTSVRVSASKECAGEALLLEIGKEGSRILGHYPYPLDSDRPLLDLMLANNNDHVAQMDRMGVQRRGDRLKKLPIKWRGRTYRQKVEYLPAEEIVRVHLVGNKYKELVYEETVPSYLQPEEVAARYHVDGYFESPRRREVAVLVSVYMFHENFDYHLHLTQLEHKRDSLTAKL